MNYLNKKISHMRCLCIIKDMKPHIIKLIKL